MTSQGAHVQAVEIRIANESNIAGIRMKGPLSEQAIRDAFDSVVAHPEYRPGMGRLWDFRDADSSALDATALRRLADYSTGHAAEVRTARVAFVASRPLEYGLSRMFEGMTEPAGVPRRAFYSLEEAEAWLRAGGAP